MAVAAHSHRVTAAYVSTAKSLDKVISEHDPTILFAEQASAVGGHCGLPHHSTFPGHQRASALPLRSMGLRDPFGRILPVTSPR